MSDGGQVQTKEGAVADVASFDLSAVYNAYYSRLCIFLRRKFGSGPPDPEDAVQAAFASFAALREPSSIQNPKAFLYRTACNFVIDHRRRAAVSTRAVADIVALNIISPPVDADPERVLEDRESLAAVSAAIAGLESRRRTVLIMYSIGELSCAEIARRLGLSPTRVVQLYAQAIEVCAKALRDAGAGGRS